MKQIKVSDLEGEQLAEWAAKAQKWEVLWIDYKDERKLRVSILGDMIEGIGADNYRPDINGAQAMELAKKFEVDLFIRKDLSTAMLCINDCSFIKQYGKTPELAVTRAVIASVYGKTVTVEDE